MFKSTHALANKIKLSAFDLVEWNKNGGAIGKPQRDRNGMKIKKTGQKTCPREGTVTPSGQDFSSVIVLVKRDRA